MENKCIDDEANEAGEAILNSIAPTYELKESTYETEDEEDFKKLVAALARDPRFEEVDWRLPPIADLPREQEGWVFTPIPAAQYPGTRITAQEDYDEEGEHDERIDDEILSAVESFGANGVVDAGVCGPSFRNREDYEAFIAALRTDDRFPKV